MVVPLKSKAPASQERALLEGMHEIKTKHASVIADKMRQGSSSIIRGWLDVVW